MLPISYSTGKAKPSIFGTNKAINEFSGQETKCKPLVVKGLLGESNPTGELRTGCRKPEIA